MSEKRALKKQAAKTLEDLKIILRRGRKEAGPDDLEKANELGQELRAALKTQDLDSIRRALASLQEHLEQNLSAFRPSATWETIKALFFALAIALFIRWGFVEPFRIPSGSMIPTLLIGDQLLVNKMSFGPDIYLPRLDPPAPGKAEAGQPAPLYTFRLGGRRLVICAKKLWVRRLPHRGEVVVFRYPDRPRDDYIKRVIGLPGETVEIKEGKIYINGQVQPHRPLEEYDGPVSRSGCSAFELYDEDLWTGSEVIIHHKIFCQSSSYSLYRSFGPTVVPPDMLFMMGDNRDQSSDSRAWGFVPVGYLKGRAMFIHLPLNPDRHYLPRWDRFFLSIQ